MADDDLIELGKRELEQLGLVPAGAVEAGYVVRDARRYPVYDAHYAANVDVLRGGWTRTRPTCSRSAATACTATTTRTTRCSPPCWRREHPGADHDLWSVNVEEEYHEEAATTGASGTGRAAPVID